MPSNYLLYILEEHRNEPYCVEQVGVAACTTCGCFPLRDRLRDCICDQLGIVPSEIALRWRGWKTDQYRGLRSVYDPALKIQMIEALCDKINELDRTQTGALAGMRGQGDFLSVRSGALLPFLIMEIWQALETLYQNPSMEVGLRSRPEALAYFLSVITNPLANQLIRQMDEHYTRGERRIARSTGLNNGVDSSSDIRGSPRVQTAESERPARIRQRLIRSQRLKRRELRKHGAQLMQSGNYRAAILIFHRLLRRNPRDWGLFYMLGQCFRFERKLITAVRCLVKAARQTRRGATSEDKGRVYLELGIALQLNGDLERSIAAFKEGIRYSPSNWRLHNALGLSHRRSGFPNEAIISYEQAQTILVDNAVHQTNGEATFEGKKILLADMEGVRRALLANTDYCTVMSNLGAACLDAGDIERAKASLDEAKDFIPAGVHFPMPRTLAEALEWNNR